MAKVKWMDTASTNYSYVVSVTSLVIILVLPIFFCGFIYRRRAEWDNKMFQNRFGAILEGTNFKYQKQNRWALIFVPVTFYLRKVIFVVSAIFLQDYILC